MDECSGEQGEEQREGADYARVRGCLEGLCMFYHPVVHLRQALSLQLRPHLLTDGLVVAVQPLQLEWTHTHTHTQENMGPPITKASSAQHFSTK